MHAVTFPHPGPPSILEWTSVDTPTPSASDVVIDVHAAGVNNADLMQRQGRYPVPAGASPILGLECSGVLSWVGADVTGWSVGDRVCALLAGGGYAEQVVVDADLLLPVPDRLDLVEAAGLPEAACTVYSNLAMRAQLCSGGTVLLHGGASGIGSFAIQWAKAIGATVLVTAGSTAKLERCRALGADVLINYREQDFVAETLAATDGAGVDAILDIVGPDYLERNVACLALDGHLVVIGSASSGPNAPLDLGRMLARRASVSATTLRSRPHSQKAAIVAAVRRDVWPLVETGAIAPVIDTVTPMEDAASAHQLLVDGTTVGKVLLSAPLTRN